MINNLVEDKLAVSQWKDTISGWDVKGEFLPILGYDKVSDKLMILPTGYSLQEIIDINNNDLIGVLPQNAGGSGGAAMRRQTEAINKLARVMSGPQEINLKNWRQAERSAMDASIREA